LMSLQPAGIARLRFADRLYRQPEEVHLSSNGNGPGGFLFLGCTIRKKRSIQRNPRMHFMQRWPSPKAMKRIRERVHELTDARHPGSTLVSFPASGSIRWTVMFSGGSPSGWEGAGDNVHSGWRSGLTTVSSEWVCID
jgi:hypothetical protein